NSGTRALSGCIQGSSIRAAAGAGIKPCCSLENKGISRLYYYFKSTSQDLKMTAQTLNFGADVSRLLDIVAHALYSNRDVFLRELISNASDACDRLRYEAIGKPDLLKDDPELKIRVFKDATDRTLTVLDN